MPWPHLLGWTQEEIAGVVGLKSQSQTHEVISKLPELVNSIKDQHSRGQGVEQIAQAQAEVAAVLGVAQQTVSDWFTTNTGTGNTCIATASQEAPACRTQ
ncbi:MAG: hypothetical protein ACLFUU_13990 [Desulfobacteraceae bacterium]